MLIRNLANKKSINTFCIVYLLYALQKNKLRKSVTSPKNFPIYLFLKKSTCKQFSLFIPVCVQGSHYRQKDMCRGNNGQGGFWNKGNFKTRISLLLCREAVGILYRIRGKSIQGRGKGEWLWGMNFLGGKRPLLKFK